MSPITNQLNYMINQLEERDQLILLEIVQRFLPDDVTTPDDLAAISAARDDYAKGETINHADIDWDNLEKYAD